MSIKKYLKFLKTENIFLILIIVFILLLSLSLPIDPDMGWHLKNGEYLLSHNFKVPATDIYSWTMPDFPLIMHEWLTDMIIFFLYKNLGLISLTILFTIITTLAFFIVARSVKAKLSYQLIACLLGVAASLPVISVRAQMITLLGLAIIIFIIQKFKEKPQTRLIYLLPIIFLIWVNFHGGFPIGLFYLLVFWGVEFFKIIVKIIAKKYFLFDFQYKIYPPRDINRIFSLLILSFLTTLINPYHLRIYYEIFTTAFDTFAKSFINEWLPLTLENPMSHRFIIYAVLVLILIFFNIKKVDLSYLIISIIFFFISISSLRHMPFFILISIPYLIYLVKFLTSDKLLLIIRKRWLIFILLIMIVIFIKQRTIPALAIVNSEITIAQLAGYPYKAVQFLKANPPAGEMFNEYNWGGYLIWQYPEKKVFIDGRMPSWRLKRPNGETQEILKDFRILKDAQEGWEKLFEKYQFDFALLYQGSPIIWHLEKRGWGKIYEDNLVVIIATPKD